MNFLTNNSQRPPNLLVGLILLNGLILLVILFLSWLIVDYQLERLIVKRSDEYARSITAVAAKTSAQALLAEDRLQLRTLVESVVDDPYVRSATIFSEDGQPLIIFPEEPAAPTIDDLASEDLSGDDLPTNDLSQDLSVSQAYQPKDRSTAELSEQKDSFQSVTATPLKVEPEQHPYVEKISYQDITAGWFKIALDKPALEADFRSRLAKTKDWVLIISAVFMALLVFVTYFYTRQVRILAGYGHRLVQLNKKHLPDDVDQLINYLTDLSNAPLDGQQQNQLKLTQPDWSLSKRSYNSLFCYAQFAIEDQESSLVVESLTIAENYLQAAAHAHGVEVQGGILSGCLVPFDDFSDTQEGLIEVVAFIHLLKELLNSLNLPIKIKAFFGIGSVLALYGKRGEMTGSALSNRMNDEISRLSSQTQFGEILSLGIDLEQLESLGKFNMIENLLEIPCARLIRVSEELQQQVDRQRRFISQQYSDER